jgi:dTDP-glucose 4,6-dehydratase
MSSNRINLVAGAAGFIGTHLAEALLRKGEKVIGVDSMITGSQENVSRLIGRPNFSFIHHDIAEPLKIDGDIHCIYNFACPASPIDLERLRIAILRACSLGSYNLLELARTKHARYIYASTSEVYGNPFEHPQKENYHGNVSITGVRAVYDEGKRYGETMLTVYGHEYDVEVRTVRVFNTHGEHMRVDDGRAIPAFITQALRNEDITIFGDGSQTRSIQYISDLVRGVLLLAESEVTLPVNIGSQSEVTMTDLATTIKHLAGSESRIIITRPLPEDDPLVRKPDISRAKQLLNWEPKVSLREGLKKTIDWFRIKVLE